jgi:hypothetical protein
MVPEGWTQHSRAELPDGSLDRERMLVSYQLLGKSRPSTFQISAADLPANTDMSKYLTGAAFGIEDWKVKPPAEHLTIDGQPATRFTFVRVTLGPGSKALREVVAFRRGERVYFFATLFPGADDKAREQIHRALESLVWK